MRILLAVDGSPAAGRAVELVESTPWPVPTIVRIIIVDETREALAGAPWLGEPIVERPVPSARLTRAFYRIVGDAQERLLARHLAATAAVLRGRVATEIVNEAQAWRADLIVVGNRGHGAFERMLLGSVSAEVVDRAPCPVLVARTSRIQRALVAVDGSEGADRAVSFVAAERLFWGAHVTVVSVANPPVIADMVPMSVGVSELALQATPESLEWHEYLARRAAAELERSGRPVEAAVLSGSPARAILEAAGDADVVVLGTRGNTGLRRLLLGSTARSVLLHAHCSVLVVREPRRRIAAERPIAVAARATAVAFA
jgi:nucleotide-binding universal stress UspA family protein